MNIHDIIDSNIFVSFFSGIPLKPIIAQEFLWRTDPLLVFKNCDVYKYIFLPLLQELTPENGSSILEPTSFGNYPPPPRSEINILTKEFIRNKIHSLPLSTHLNFAISHYYYAYSYSDSAIISWTGHWTKNRLYFDGPFIPFNAINDWKLIINEFPIKHLFIQYETGSYQRNNGLEYLTIFIKNNKLTYEFDNPIEKPKKSYSIIRRPPLNLLQSSFNYVKNKFKETDPTSRFPLFAAKPH